MASEFIYQLTDIAQEDFDNMIRYMLENLCNHQAAVT